MKKHNRLALFKEYQDQPDDEVTLEKVFEKLVIWGTPDKVADELLAFRENVGQFGTLLYAGKDWLSPELGRRSMELLAEKVQPKIDEIEQKQSQAAQ